MKKTTSQNKTKIKERILHNVCEFFPWIMQKWVLIPNYAQKNKNSLRTVHVGRHARLFFF